MCYMNSDLRILIFSLFFSAKCLMAYNSNSQIPKLEIKRANGEIKIDGIVNEDDWLEADVASNFINHWPSDSGTAEAIKPATL